MFEKFRYLLSYRHHPTSPYEILTEALKYQDVTSIVQTMSGLGQDPRLKDYFYTLKAIAYQFAALNSIEINPFTPFAVVQHDSRDVTTIQDPLYTLTDYDRAMIQVYQALDYQGFEHYCSISGRAYTDRKKRSGVTFTIIQRDNEIPNLYTNSFINIKE